MDIDLDRMRRLAAAIRGLYAAPHDEHAWPGILRAAARIFDGEAAFVRLMTGDTSRDPFLASWDYSPSDLDDYARNYAEDDLWSLALPGKARPGAALTGDQLARRASSPRAPRRSTNSVRREAPPAASFPDRSERRPRVVPRGQRRRRGE